MTKTNIVVTTNGDELRISPVSSQVLEMISTAVEKEFRADNEPIDVPTYEAETVGGGSETLEHDEDSARTDEEKEEWAAHIDAIARMENEMNERRTRYCFTAGLQMTLPEDDSWMAHQKSYGVEIPEDDPTELFFHYLYTEILRTPNDIISVSTEIMRLTYDGVDPAIIEATEKSFRDKLSSRTEEYKDSLEQPTDS